ncbi:hypothetical protein AQUSIP_19030 [Aquicella siphonis]|uniref:Uncharacterized protein n=1 Tax=Aquicella siphonis TaxID=254247 RepID=A0A5E4PJW3_9COXI|nr:hypothetical protein [Aquicella siphonis]VVC76586.1 hypothetical protein AQUSIP_19030 [Aquicella siphonis]
MFSGKKNEKIELKELTREGTYKSVESEAQSGITFWGEHPDDNQGLLSLFFRSSTPAIFDGQRAEINSQGEGPQDNTSKQQALPAPPRYSK